MAASLGRSSDWTWKQAVADQVLLIADNRPESTFGINEIYFSAVPVLSSLFPRNQHVKEKIRQSLQKLREDGFLVIEGGGRYRLNLENEEFEQQPARPLPSGTVSPATRNVTRRVRLRDTLLAIEIKRRYRNTCQVCRSPVWLQAGKAYAEGHHLWPLGVPHCGPDTPGTSSFCAPITTSCSIAAWLRSRQGRSSYAML